MGTIRTSILGILCFSSSCAMASDIEEIVVTANFRPTNEMSTPQSVSVVSANTIKARGAQQLEDIIDAVPNLNFNSGTGRARFFQIRGIGEREQFADPLNPSVGLLIDNVDFSGAGTIATMFDVKQVEVLRGPQGTRYGANGLAGLINIETNDPQDEFSAKLGGSLGNYHTGSVYGVVTGPISSSVDYRLAAEKYRSNGYTYNAYLHRHDVDKRAESTVRGKLKIDTGGNWQTKLTIAEVDINDGYDVFSLDNSGITQSDQPGKDGQKSRYAAANTLWRFSPFNVRMIASITNSDMVYGYDEDWTYVGYAPNGYSSTDYYYRNRKTKSLEVRAVSNDPGRLFGGSTDWVAGLYLFDSHEDLHRVYTYLANDFYSRYDFTTAAAYFQLNTALGDRTTLSEGLRIETRHTRYHDTNTVSFQPQETLWGGQLSLKHQLTDKVMVYVRVARGYKAGGFNTDGSLPPDLRQFGSEYLWEFESGIKAITLQDRLQLRATVFYDLRRHQQVKSSVVQVRSDGSSAFIGYFGNAAKGRNTGMELESDWLATGNLSVFANIGLLHARFDQYINEFGQDLSGRDQAQAPHYTYSVGFNYERSAWTWHLSVNGKGSYYFANRHNVKSIPYTLVNTRIAYEGDDYTVSVWARNLTNKAYYTEAFGSFGNDPRNDYAIEPYYQYGEPRVFGVTFEYRL